MLCLLPISCIFPWFSYWPFLSLFHTADALTAANAHIASLEAEVNASRKAWDTATAAKVAAKKTAK
jgi:hypothetical protein